MMTNNQSIQCKIEEEIWKPIAEWNAYEVSSLGRIRSLDRDIKYNGRNGIWKCKGRILTLRLLKGGYQIAQLNSNDKKYKDFLVHRLVALAFIENLHSEPEVNHKNGVKTDNRAVNLEWVTSKANKAHASIILGHKFGASNCKPILARNDHAIIKFNSMKDADLFGFDKSSISRCLKDANRKYAGYNWLHARSA